MTQHLTERSCRFLKSASEVPRLYRRTNKVSKVELFFCVFLSPFCSGGQKVKRTVLPFYSDLFHILKCIYFQNDFVFNFSIVSIPLSFLYLLVNFWIGFSCSSHKHPFQTGNSIASLSLHGQRLTASASTNVRLNRTRHALNGTRLAASHTVGMHAEVSSWCAQICTSNKAPTRVLRTALSSSSTSSSSAAYPGVVFCASFPHPAWLDITRRSRRC